MADLDQDMQEYRDIKRWLAGEKPPSLGRTMYRKVKQVTAAVEVAAVVVTKAAKEHPRVAVGIACGGVFAGILPILIGLGIITMGMSFLSSFLETEMQNGPNAIGIQASMQALVSGLQNGILPILTTVGILIVTVKIIVGR